jgi:ribonuclease P protein subunit RPR2
MRKYKNTQSDIKKIVTERVMHLFIQAENTVEIYPERAKRYVILARKLSTRNKVRLPYGSSRRFCRTCNSFFRHGINLRIRTRDGKQVYQCLECKTIKRFPFYKERKEKRTNKKN